MNCEGPYFTNMAQVKIFSFFLYIELVLLLMVIKIVVVHSEVNHVAYPKNSICLSSTSSSQYYFDISGLQCKLCDSTIASNSIPEYNNNNDNTDNDIAYQCTCPKNSLKVLNACSLRELQSGTCKSFECLSSTSSSSNICHENKQDISINGQYCTSCSSSTNNNNNNMVFYDELKKECSCNNPKKSISTKTPIITRKLVELYNDNDNNSEQQQKPTNKICMTCPYGSAVLINELLLDNNDNDNNNELQQQKYYITAGKKYKPNKFKCSYCPDPNNMFFDTDYNCICKNDYTIVGESSIGEQSCIHKIPTISSSYTKAEFRYLNNNNNAQETTNAIYNVDSIIYSHYYLKAASKCEYLESTFMYDESLSSCQTLGNLCVLNLYDLSSTSCRQFQNIIAEDRALTTSSYHKQEDWKYSLPWLYYLDEADDIITDRGIQMKMSFDSSSSLTTSTSFTTNKLRFKLAKYTLDGKFLSLEDLTNQFFYCDTTTESGSNPNNNNDNSNTYSIDDILFGTSKRFESKCDLSTLIYNNEMYFYDMYLVDEGDTSTISSCNNNQQNNINEGIDTECLYPIPVLNRNFIQGLSSPNMNRFKEDTFDDRCTRRFFLFDNVSGRSAMNGHEILRYAKTIVLQTTIQNEDPDGSFT